MGSGNYLSFHWLHLLYCTIFAKDALMLASSAHLAGSAIAYSTRSLHGLTDKKTAWPGSSPANKQDERIYGRTPFLVEPLS